MSFLRTILGDPNARVVRSLDPFVEKINALEPEVRQNTDLGGSAEGLRKRLKGGETLDDLLPECFALVREAARRTLGQRHYDVQLKGGIVLHRGQIAEMRTGEGKTLVATLPASLNALSGNGVHIVTVNDYLARRDCAWMGGIYACLGLSVAAIGHEAAYRYDAATEGNLRRVSRKEAYDADILYGTNNEFGFDYLRDNMVARLSDEVRRGHAYAIVDEVDSILIDEARTPLIISAPAEESTEQYFEFAKLVTKLQRDPHYTIDEKMRSAVLTEEGIHAVEKMLGVDNLYAGDLRTVHHVEQALRAQALYQRDRDYVVKDGEVIIVDEFTGRLMFGRRYSEGLHQAIEAKEGVAVQRESQTLATITFQNFFRLYQKLAGMTGTAATEAEEFSKNYGLEVVVIPTNKDSRRADLADRVYKNERGKFSQVVEEIRSRHERGQPLLVGTVSIAKNETLSEMLEAAGVPFQLLNAKNHEKEAAIIANAGRRGAVTVATNMAGRGVDIILGGVPPQEISASPYAAERTIEDWQREHEEVVSLGGLHVIGTERHESRRIDNQLRGRSGRQGDPGSTQFYLSMEDDVMRIFGGDRVKRLMERLGVPDDLPIENRLVTKSIESAQTKVEQHNFEIRKRLLEYDDVANKQREVVYRRRREYLTAPEESDARVREMIRLEIDHALLVAFPDDDRSNDAEFLEFTRSIFPVSEELERSITEVARDRSLTPWHRRTSIGERVEKAIQEFDARFTQSVIEDARRRSLPNPELVLENIQTSVLMRTLDTLWIEHLDAMDHLRTGIGLRGYGQRDPLVEFKRESFRMFNELLAFHQQEVVRTVFRVGVAAIQAHSIYERRGIQLSAPAKNSGNGVNSVMGSNVNGQLSSVVNVGRNDPCPCGAKKADGTPLKYKRCHGK